MVWRILTHRLGGEVPGGFPDQVDEARRHA
jgi:hypothetical protein